MSLSKPGVASAPLALALVLCAGQARAESGPLDPFFSDKVDAAEAAGEAPTSTLIQGSLTSTTFAYAETGDTPVDPEVISNYSPARRLFTDLRAQLDARHVSGSSWDMRVDARLRVTPDCEFQTLGISLEPNIYPDCRGQSGLMGGNEYDAREVYARRAGEQSDLFVGRQYVHELAATKIDGVRFQYHKSEKWSLLGFGGLHPARGSRSITTDYPRRRINDFQEGAPITPIAAGLGGAYRMHNLYGSLGAVGIVPLARDRIDRNYEDPRVFLTGTGYWRPSGMLDVYHYLVVDVHGADGPGLTNASVGVSAQPTPTVRVVAAVNHVDTETLNVTAQSYLKDIEVYDAQLLRNDVLVSRISSQSARLGVSVALMDNRFEISTSGQVRQRPELALLAIDGATRIVIPATRAADVQLSVVDRRSIAGLRLGASVLRISGLGEEVNPGHSDATVLRLDATRDIREGRGQIEANLAYIGSKDERREDDCQLDLLTCYGTSEVSTVSAGGTLFYRVGPSWFVMANVNIGRQVLTHAFQGNFYEQPPNLLLSAFARLAYRF